MQVVQRSRRDTTTQQVGGRGQHISVFDREVDGNLEIGEPGAQHHCNDVGMCRYADGGSGLERRMFVGSRR
jgi:hypothetical protein